MHDGYKISLTRRRYGRNTTFTWVDVFIGGRWVSSGDPVQKIRPSKEDLSQFVETALRHSASDDAARIRENKL